MKSLVHHLLVAETMPLSLSSVLVDRYVWKITFLVKRISKAVWKPLKYLNIYFIIIIIVFSSGNRFYFVILGKTIYYITVYEKKIQNMIKGMFLFLKALQQLVNFQIVDILKFWNFVFPKIGGNLRKSKYIPKNLIYQTIKTVIRGSTILNVMAKLSLTVCYLFLLIELISNYKKITFNFFLLWKVCECWERRKQVHSRYCGNDCWYQRTFDAGCHNFNERKSTSSWAPSKNLLSLFIVFFFIFNDFVFQQIGSGILDFKGCIHGVFY